MELKGKEDQSYFEGSRGGRGGGSEGAAEDKLRIHQELKGIVSEGKAMGGGRDVRKGG